MLKYEEYLKLPKWKQNLFKAVWLFGTLLLLGMSGMIENGVL